MFIGFTFVSSQFILSHFFIKLLKGNGNFYDTSKALLYANTPLFLGEYILSFLIIFLNIPITPETVTAGQAVGSAFVIKILLVIIIAISTTAYYIHINLIGLSKYHNISRKRVLGAFLLQGLVIIILLIIIVVSLISGSIGMLKTNLIGSLAQGNLTSQLGEKIMITYCNVDSNSVHVKNTGSSYLNPTETVIKINGVVADVACQGDSYPGAAFVCNVQTPDIKTGDTVRAETASGAFGEIVCPTV